ncbi:hypothetical protein [Phaeospirillum tilakii]|uniref:Uncharacterized protein n=1 Tax=Phaeospirillum tilakii TaxID=741673 RepID=A0ABW5C7C2_9PROT
MSESATAVFRINLALRGPVVDILGQFLPELNALPREDAYDRVMDDLGLLGRCFAVFRRERARFRAVLIDERHRPVSDDFVPLSCGRSLAEVIAMVVRTAAKRYFRRSLAPAPARPAEPPRRSPADELYDAIKAYLLHDWQVPLVPHYARLTPSTVRRLGRRLLEAREPDALTRLVDGPDPAEARPARPAGPLPTALSGGRPTATARRSSAASATAAEILSPDSHQLHPDAFVPVWLDPDVRAALPNPDNVRAAAEILRGVGAAPAVALVEGLGLRKEQLAVMLLVAEDCIGTTVFGRLFGPRADPELVARIVDRARLHGIGPEAGTIECALFMRSVFARFGHRSRHAD